MRGMMRHACAELRPGDSEPRLGLWRGRGIALTGSEWCPAEGAVHSAPWAGRSDAHDAHAAVLLRAPFGTPAAPAIW
jgi:hypothetical protein